ncbi:MAG TPA: DUF433 domain-containing protein [Bryobacteraceae bacterium]|jgi:uncharacterized protein (DUF433 family)|nr:DUF433 domain-containing protein [Bryobacteraceae bacterium]
MGIERITANLDGQPVIRGLAIKFWDVYRDLALHGMTAREVIRKYPDLEPEDIGAVREYAVHLVKSRTHDEFTGRPILPKDRLVHGRYYKGRCRNTTIARWHAYEAQFYFWRVKFDRIDIQTIKYPTDEADAMLDRFDVVEELPHPKFEIAFDHKAVFTGSRGDLFEFNEEMWSRPD